MSASVATAVRSREDEFMERYPRLLKWARRTASDHSLAEDVVHEAYVQFMLSGTDHVSISNIDQYLREVLRNIHRTHLRQSAPQRFQQLSMMPDTLQAMLSDSDPRERLQASAVLNAICAYTCRRKDASIASSVLILRFFHGYYPNEVAKLIHRTRNAVDALLKSARRDLTLFLRSPAVAITGSERTGQDLRRSDSNASDVVSECRRTIFAARKGRCFGSERLAAIYGNDDTMLSRAALSHLVSCAECLSMANELLGLPPLRERSPVDALGKVGEEKPGSASVPLAEREARTTFP
jgi:RNA polymerase sigma factor (sigma-70 family)